MIYPLPGVRSHGSIAKCLIHGRFQMLHQAISCWTWAPARTMHFWLEEQLAATTRLDLQVWSHWARVMEWAAGAAGAVLAGFACVAAAGTVTTLPSWPASILYLSLRVKLVHSNPSVPASSCWVQFATSCGDFPAAQVRCSGSCGRKVTS